MPEKRPEKGRQASGVGVSDALGHGLGWAGGTLIFLLLGRWLDGRLGTAPLLTIVLALVGAAAGFYSMYRHLVLDPQRKEKSEREEHEE